MKIENWKKRIFASRQRQCMPIMTHPGIEINKATIRDAVSNGKIHYEAIATLTEKFPTAAATTMMDLSIEAEMFGSEIHFSDQEIPVITGRIVSNYSEIKQLSLPPVNRGRFPEYLTATELAVQNIKDRPVFAGCIGPFSLAGRLFDLSDLMMAILIEPETIQLLIKKCTEFLGYYIDEFKTLHADGVIIAEPSAGMLSPDLCDRFSSDFIKLLVQDLQDDSFKIILHNCGNTAPLLNSIQKTGAAAIHLGYQCPLETALRAIHKDTLLFGNIDPVNTLKMGKAKEVREQTIKSLEAARGYKNFVISSGCDIPPQTPIENIQSLFDSVSEYNQI